MNVIIIWPQQSYHLNWQQHTPTKRWSERLQISRMLSQVPHIENYSHYFLLAIHYSIGHRHYYNDPSFEFIRNNC